MVANSPETHAILIWSHPSRYSAPRPLPCSLSFHSLKSDFLSTPVHKAKEVPVNNQSINQSTISFLCIYRVYEEEKPLLNDSLKWVRNREAS